MCTITLSYDPCLYEDHGDLPPLPEDKEFYTPEELRDILMEDLRAIYNNPNGTMPIERALDITRNAVEHEYA